MFSEPKGLHVNHKKLEVVVRKWWPKNIPIGYSCKLNTDQMKTVIRTYMVALAKKHMVSAYELYLIIYKLPDGVSHNLNAPWETSIGRNLYDTPPPGISSKNVRSFPDFLNV